MDKLSNHPPQLAPLDAVVTSFAYAVPLLPKECDDEYGESGGVAALLDTREGKAFREIVRQVNAELSHHGREAFIPVVSLSQDGWQELVDHAQRPYHELAVHDQCDPFNNNPGSTMSPPRSQSDISLGVFQDFVSALEGTPTNIKHTVCPRLSQLSHLFGFRSIMRDGDKLDKSKVSAWALAGSAKTCGSIPFKSKSKVCQSNDSVFGWHDLTTIRIPASNEVVWNDCRDEHKSSVLVTCEFDSKL
jgi:hypothetical protein